MALRFVGIDPATAETGSPTVWVDEETHDIVVQGWTADEALRQLITETPAPGHAAGIPAHESAVRVPARLAAALRAACDVAEGP